MLMLAFRLRTAPSPIATLHPPGWKPYSSPWFHPLTVTAPFRWAAVDTFPAGLTPGVIGPCVPAQTMLLLSEPQAPPRNPSVAAVGSCFPARPPPNPAPEPAATQGVASALVAC